MGSSPASLLVGARAASTRTAPSGAASSDTAEASLDEQPVASHGPSASQAVPPSTMEHTLNRFIRRPTVTPARSSAAARTHLTDRNNVARGRLRATFGADVSGNHVSLPRAPVAAARGRRYVEWIRVGARGLLELGAREGRGGHRRASALPRFGVRGRDAAMQSDRRPRGVPSGRRLRCLPAARGLRGRERLS